MKIKLTGMLLITLIISHISLGASLSAPAKPPIYIPHQGYFDNAHSLQASESYIHPLIPHGRHGIYAARADFAALHPKMQSHIQITSCMKIDGMPADFSWYEQLEKGQVYVIYTAYKSKRRVQNTTGYLGMSIRFNQAVPEAYIPEFFIHERHRNQKFGKWLMRIALDDFFHNMSPKGTVSLKLSGNMKNKTKLQAFYGKFGFVLTDPLSDIYPTMVLDYKQYQKIGLLLAHV